ncbi:MAG: hypothetical protein GY754_42155 [bacterium]|nr:hypothetical protein [bacterium]
MQSAENLNSDSNVNTTYYHRRKISETQQIEIRKLLQNNPKYTTVAIFKEFKKRGNPINTTVRHLNRLRSGWKLSRCVGRPRHSNLIETPKTQINIIKVRQSVPRIGIHIFDDYMEKEGLFSNLIILLKQAIERFKEKYPENHFPLLSHKEETLLRLMKALIYATLFEIEKLTNYDVKEHSLPLLLSNEGYHSSTLNQFLGQLERIGVGEIFKQALLPAVSGKIGYIDGCMSAFWTRESMHKGKITMLGRIMAGSNAVIAHDENGYAMYFEYHHPDIRLNHIILGYCKTIQSRTGIEIFIIDREINSVDMAILFKKEGLGLLSMLDSNEYKELSDFNYEDIGKLEDGSKVYKGKWRKTEEPKKSEKSKKPTKQEQKKLDDPRTFVIVDNGKKLLVYWGTPKVEAAIDPIEWPKKYSQRNEIQELSFKRMTSHGALKTNYGIKKIKTLDRHQQRQLLPLKEKIEATKKKIVKKKEEIKEQCKKVEESKGKKGHFKRLSQRRRRKKKMDGELKKIKNKEKSLNEEIEKLGKPGQREDRDFRKQTIMAFRTLFLENSLMQFLTALLSVIKIKISLEALIELFMKRSGSYIETNSKIIYGINTFGLSESNKKILIEIVKGVNLMNLTRNGKSIWVEAREGS